MYVIVDNNLYRYHGYGFASTAEKLYSKVKTYPTKADIPSWTDGLVFIEKSNLPNGFYRKRDGKLVRIPDQWVGKIPNARTKRARQSVSRRTRSGP